MFCDYEFLVNEHESMRGGEEMKKQRERNVIKYIGRKEETK